MNKYRIIAVDLDKTLLNSEGKLSKTNRSALQKAAEMGITVVPATGRVKSTILDEIIEAGYVRYVICSNGAIIYDKANQHAIYEHCIPAEGIDRIWNYLEDTSFMKDYFFEGRPYTDSLYHENLGKYGVTDYFMDYYKSTRTPISGFESFLEGKKDKIEVINFIFPDNAKRLSIWEELNNIPCLEVTTSLPFNLEISASGMNKGAALKYLCEFLKVGEDEVIAIGDNENDVSMINFAGMGVAMDNAVYNVKAAADFMTLSNDQDGVAWALERLSVLP